MNRRAFIVASAAGLVGCAVKPIAPRQLPRIGVQLYTVREAMQEDTVGTLAAVAEAGYAEVETAGTGTLSVVQFAQALKDVGLSAPAAHVPINLIIDEPDTLLSAAQSIGYEYLVVPWIPPDLRTQSGYAKVAGALNTFGERCAAEGVRACYHNHDFEFASVDGMVPWQFLLAETDPALVDFELDLFWVTHAGVDAAAVLAANPDRYPLCHVKDRDAAGNMVDVGDGVIDFPTLFRAGSGLKHHFVEHDRPERPMASIRRSISHLQSLNY